MIYSINPIFTPNTQSESAADPLGAAPARLDELWM
jgi:hypothetical protein